MKTSLTALAAAMLLSLPGPLRAESLMFEYYSLLGPADVSSSGGTPLNDICTILQQDRANWHKFGKREQHDSGDPFFTTTERRAMIAGKCDYDRSYFANAGDNIRSGFKHYYVYVRVFGNGSQISRIQISEGAG